MNFPSLHLTKKTVLVGVAIAVAVVAAAFTGVNVVSYNRSKTDGGAPGTGTTSQKIVRNVGFIGTHFGRKAHEKANPTAKSTVQNTPVNENKTANENENE